jgi:GNAT superfamily N-acetyltransferase
MALRIETVSGPAIVPHLPALSRLRIAVFRAWPYLYDGDAVQEAAYLAEFAHADSAAIVLARDGEEVAGCSTCVALAEQDADLQAPFRALGIDPARVFYFGESVLLERYRGQGAGVAFFRAREAHARRVASPDYAAFCSVIRPTEHPLRPPGAVPLDAFWRRRGYAPYPALSCQMNWKQVDGDAEVENRLSFWIKSLSGRALP